MLHTILYKPESPAHKQLPVAAMLTALALAGVSIITLGTLLPRMPHPGARRCDWPLPCRFR